MGARGILHDGNWRLSCSATAACLKPGRPPSLPSPSGGRRESQRGRGSPLPPRFPPPLGEGEGGGRQKRKKLPHPCPLPQAGEGVHTKFIAASSCCMGARGILHDGNWRLSCSATAACLKPGRPPSLPSPSGGRRESQRGRGSPLPPRFPPPLGEGEGGGRQKRKKLPHPCPLPQAGEGVHTKFIAASACCMGARGIFHDENWWLSCSAAGVMPQGWLAPIPAFPQRGKERRPEGTEQRWAGGRSTLTLTLSRKREREKAFPPPLGEGEGQPNASPLPA